MAVVACMLFVVCWWVRAVCCLVCSALSSVYYGLFVVFVLVARVLLFVADCIIGSCCLLSVVVCYVLLFVVCWLLCVSVCCPCVVCCCSSFVVT